MHYLKYKIYHMVSKNAKIQLRCRNISNEAELPLKKFEYHSMEEEIKSTTVLKRDDALKYYREMATIRRMETVAADLYMKKIIRGFLHLYAGQEACAVGQRCCMMKKDKMVTAYRCHGWALMMGLTVSQILGELAEKEVGAARGKGGSMHIYAKDFYGGNGIVGASASIGTGVGFKLKYNGTKGVVLNIFGDGAANQGQVYEVYNMAGLWKLPVLFVCENNLYGMGTKIDRAAANPLIYQHPSHFPGIRVDGMDVLSVREGTRFARDFIMSGRGPILLELMTYRYYGHSMSDPGVSYRTRAEIQEVRRTRDPITTFRDKLIEADLSTAEELKKIDVEVRKHIETQLQLVVESRTVPEEEAWHDVYSTDIVQPIRSKLPHHHTPHKRVGKLLNVDE